jgi:hypothetical protein
MCLLHSCQLVYVMCLFVSSQSRFFLHETFLIVLFEHSLSRVEGWISPCYIYIVYCHAFPPSAKGGMDKYFEGSMSMDLHTKTRPLGTFELSMVNQQYKGSGLLWYCSI